jgi:hypothetical protein
MTFRIGQKVVCIDAQCAAGFDWYGFPPTEGAVYTVAGFGRNPVYGHEVIKIAELGHPWGYKPRRFRPVVERKTDISFAHEILRKASKPARAPALSSPNGAST